MTRDARRGEKGPMMAVEQIYTHQFPSGGGVWLCGVALRMDAFANKLSIHVEERETDGLGLARGALVKLTSGRVVLLYELAHSADHFDARGPTVEVDAGEAAALGLSSLMNEVKVDLGLRDEEIVAINHDADDWRRDAAIASRYRPGWTSLK